ncbi:phosphatidylinositol alpha 1,6-mannosyltransferase [Plantibacter flavus]|uniref:D-inositol 3-phosphate glycosyltransferase n=1 Tax=Plantibacter flavus TaxID=150123 RepID=A0A3N2C0W6_9MICO|nr:MULTISPECIES: glycosyltransferase family 1 protein [unclassified Plantibacter]ROR81157.1 phosphatidylinositol alpha 1,6-mannosyltransferase [Plantibacter flavus]SMG08479.1 phosphatidylinositol alpha 1,6-mannosyltransferase [Plantibacter flavus]
MGVRIAIVTESFLPQMNGVTHSLLRIMEHFADRGDEVLVIAPGAGASTPRLHEGFRVDGVPSIPLPRYRNVRVAAGGVGRITELLRGFRPDVVHLASPFVLGWRGVQAAERLGVPTVAVYQTDIPAYAGRYGFPVAEALLWQHVERLHGRSTLTLAPSRQSIAQLEAHAIPRVRLWVRGVDAVRFSPERRSEAWRRSVAPGGERIVGYVGRLAAEKQVEDLAVLGGLPGVKLVIVGEGPLRASLEQRLPNAVFTGFLGGEELAVAMAGLDVFVHPGESETFCQTIQEAMASGVPVVATGRGGPVDLVDSSRTGWLYEPGRLEQLRGFVQDLVGDEVKRAAFGAAARAGVLPRSWKSVSSALIGHYSDAIELHEGARARRSGLDPRVQVPRVTRPGTGRRSGA